eukprot:31489-Prymnesium_polylepis.1
MARSLDLITARSGTETGDQSRCANQGRNQDVGMTNQLAPSFMLGRKGGKEGKRGRRVTRNS